jgi:mRNA-degrading endonuclease RelE of RelBE toxin-antitoxin system
MRFVETRVFTRQVDLLLSDEEYRALQNALLADPTKGSLMRGTGGLRKLRWSIDQRGKRGGIRVIYYWSVSKETIALLFTYPKNVQDDQKSGASPAIYCWGEPLAPLGAQS